MDDSRTGLFGLGFGLSFTAFLVLLIGTKAAWFTGIGVLAVVAAILTIVFLVLFLNGQPFTFQTTPAATPVATPAATPAPTPTPVVTKAKTEAYYDYKGDVHDVIDVEGIGPKYADKLKAAGIETTARLVYVGADEIAKICDVPKKTAEKWIAMCQLIKVNGIGKQYAEALVRGGVMTIEELKKGDPELMAGQVTSYLESLNTNVLGQKVTAKRVQGWQSKAGSMRRVRTTIPEN
ncbi:MAG: DUF4332 domain-containing protein [Thermoplasmatota archaeon]